jgi:hypothetical protein
MPHGEELVTRGVIGQRTARRSPQRTIFRGVVIRGLLRVDSEPVKVSAMLPRPAGVEQAEPQMTLQRQRRPP